jgi:hypothetical protein
MLFSVIFARQYKMVNKVKLIQELNDPAIQVKKDISRRMYHPAFCNILCVLL